MMKRVNVTDPPAFSSVTISAVDGSDDDVDIFLLTAVATADGVGRMTWLHNEREEESVRGCRSRGRPVSRSSSRPQSEVGRQRCAARSQFHFLQEILKGPMAAAPREEESVLTQGSRGGGRIKGNHVLRSSVQPCSRVRPPLPAFAVRASTPPRTSLASASALALAD